jgi:DNA-binding MarR family transcriptional regulator
MTTGTSLFREMWREWRSKIPERLANEDPETLIRLLELCDNDSGVFQSEVKRELGVNQPKLSKLTRKLVDQAWITVKKSEKDGRVTPMKTTRIAQKWLSNLQERLSTLQDSPPPGRIRIPRRASPSKPETYSMFDEMPDPNAKEPKRCDANETDSILGFERL